MRPLLESIANTSPAAEVLFICDPDDIPERRAIQAETRRMALRILTVVRRGGWAYKINEAVRETPRRLLFLGADDLDFRAGWFDAAAGRLDDQVHVVGINDLIRRRRTHTTHFLMTAEYAHQPLLDGGRGPVCEAYDHSFCDDELIATATHRGAYAYAEDALVEHLHPFGGRGEDDDVYRKGRAQFRIDKKRFLRRQALWT